MTELLSAAQMRSIEEAEIAAGRVTGRDLMERAGRGVVDAVFAQWPELAAGPFRAVVLCGPGNNGGDGFVVARLLKQWGWAVEVFLYGDADRLTPDARRNYERWVGMGAVRPFPQERPDAWSARLIVDAMFGTGLTRPLPDDIMAAILGCLPEGDLKEEKDPPHVVCVDLPTGLSADTGALLPAAVCADLTVTFHAIKLGHVLGRGPEFCGRLALVDLGIGAQPDRGLVGRSPDSVVRLIDSVPPLGKRGGGHKFGYGHALILSGGPGKGGAARMAARGALRIGAGLVSLGVPPAALQENAARLDAVMLRSVKDADALSAWLHEDARINALCIGPSFGTGPRHGAWVGAVLDARRPTVLDADALTLVAQDAVLFGKLHEGCVLTPHGGEFARLFPDIAARLAAPATRGPAYSKVDATRDAARRAGCVVLFKGPDTVIADPQGHCAVNSAHYGRAAPWLATAGSGDVLAGFITGLLARGSDPMKAAETAAWLHVECARNFGPGLIAEDIPETLPDILRALGVT